MASGVKLQMVFGTMTGQKTWSFSDVLADPGNANVKALGAAMISNGSIMANPPVRLISAKTVVTTENAIDVS